MFKEPSCIIPGFTIYIRDFFFPKEVTGRKYFNQGSDLIRFTFNILSLRKKNKNKNLLLISKKRELIHSSIKY